MRLVRQSPGSWQYHLNQNEVEILLGLMRKFPFTEADPVQISKTDPEPAALEREKLLVESLAEHRKKLKQQARGLLGGKKWQQTGNDHWLTLDADSREILLQLLNDIRVGCWHALGEPEILDSRSSHDPTKDQAYRHLMDLAGYFEMGLLEAEA